jgi:hypothetical protein
MMSLSLFLVSIACHSRSLRATGAGGTSAGIGGAAGGAGGAAAGAGGMPAGADAGDACAEPPSAVPDLAPFQPPSNPALPAFQVTFHNRCAQTVWPAYGSSGGLDSSVIDTHLWLPMSPASDRTVSVYGGVREIGFWGRTGCSFDQAGKGTCETGECGGFLCPITVNLFPASATIFVLDRGFLGGYNVALRVEGAACGSHECVADVRGCSAASLVKDSCGSTIACNDICGGSATQCCSRPGSGCSSTGPSDGSPADDLVVTFCP